MANISDSKKRNLKEPDQFTTAGALALKFLMENKKIIYIALFCLILIGFILTGAQYYLSATEQKAYVFFNKGVEATLKTENDPSKDFEEVLARYPNTEAGKLAVLVYGDYAYKKGDYDKAIGLYEKGLKSFANNPDVKSLILYGIASCYETKKDYKTASSYFVNMVDMKSGILKDWAHYRLGCIYETMQDVTEARTQYEKLIEGYPESTYYQKAKNRAERLKS
ncbi:MAG: tetratricopeptide repeat protein [Pseudomonadota bacterium]